MHLYYSGTGRAPATKDIIEEFLIDEFHWTPQEIKKIPYKDIQKLFVIRSTKYNAREVRSNIDKFKYEQQQMIKSKSKGGRLKTVREI